MIEVGFGCSPMVHFKAAATGKSLARLPSLSCGGRPALGRTLSSVSIGLAWLL